MHFCFHFIAVPSSAPVHLQGIAVNSTSILLHWEPPPLADQNGVICSFLINIIVTETGSFFQLHSEMNTLNILTLHPYYTYILSVAAVTIGPGPCGEAVTIHMPEDGSYLLCLLVYDLVMCCFTSYCSSKQPTSGPPRDCS